MMSVSDEAQYHRSASERLAELIRQEDHRQQSLENKAALAATVALAVAAYSAQTIGSISVYSVFGFAVAIGVACVGASLVFAYRTHAVARASFIAPAQFVKTEILLLTVAQREVQLSAHIANTLTAMRKEGQAKANDAYRAQQWAIVAALLFLVLGLVGK